MPTFKNALSAQVRIFIEPFGKGENKRNIRRPILINRHTGLPYELITTYIYRHHGQRSLNTQIAVLRDLAFYVEWSVLQKARNINWGAPEKRAKNNQPPLTEKEISSLSNWCQLFASEMNDAVLKEKRSVSLIPTGAAVDVSTTNSRLRNICCYLEWLIDEFIENATNICDGDIIRSIHFKKKLRKSFTNSLNGEKKAPPIKSLSAEASTALRAELSIIKLFHENHTGIRDKLIVETFLETGLRSGELLKLKCEDISHNYEIKPNKHISFIKVRRRPNDIEDERKIEPSVKTLPGTVSISSALANRLIRYVIDQRRHAVNNRLDGKETPYIFVCHIGPNIGKPISQRNLNRIVAKLKNIHGIPGFLSPHVLRHTHFTELAELASASGRDAEQIKSMLVNRGRWSPNSSMPDLYTQGEIKRQEQIFIDERDKIIEPRRSN